MAMRFSMAALRCRTEPSLAAILSRDDGDPYGTRTRVFAVRGRRPRPLDEGAAARSADGAYGGGAPAVKERGRRRRRPLRNLSKSADQLVGFSPVSPSAGGASSAGGVPAAPAAAPAAAGPGGAGGGASGRG